MSLLKGLFSAKKAAHRGYRMLILRPLNTVRSQLHRRPHLVGLSMSSVPMHSPETEREGVCVCVCVWVGGCVCQHAIMLVS